MQPETHSEPADIAKQPERRGQAWSIEEERQLYDAFAAGRTVAECMTTHRRTGSGIRSCLQRLGLITEEGSIISPRPDFIPTAASQKRKLKAEAPPKRKFLPRMEPKENLTPELNERFRTALHLMENTDKNLFITGKAGTGKSTLLSYFCRMTQKPTVVLAPTGVAALNVKGQTIHRFFNFYVDITPEKIASRRTKPRNPKLYKKLRTIIIDEVSMVRADLLDCIDAFLRIYGPEPGRVFGGVQMIFVGDLYQLPPVVSGQEKELFEGYYETPYFFSSRALQDCDFEIVELDKVYRQKDEDFVDLLNAIRNNTIGPSGIARINSRVGAAALPAMGDFYITLTTTNAIADGINDAHLTALAGTPYRSQARIEGDFGKEYFPTSTDLQYKVGAQIMLLNNDNEKRWVNGSIGAIADMKRDAEGKDYLAVRLQDTGATVEVYPFTWEVYRFGLEGDAIVSEPVGTFTQYPFRLAWAVTIHKSQGKTFQRVVIDIGRGTFAAGQIYVALSRCTSFEGIILKTPIAKHHIRTDARIQEFLTAYLYRKVA